MQGASDAEAKWQRWKQDRAQRQGGGGHGGGGGGAPQQEEPEQRAKAYNPNFHGEPSTIKVQCACIAPRCVCVAPCRALAFCVLRSAFALRC